MKETLTPGESPFWGLRFRSFVLVSGFDIRIADFCIASSGDRQ
jgi:hypothetical protein